MRIQPIAKWYDFWVGFFWDGKKRRLYILPVPCLGVMLEFQRLTEEERAVRRSERAQVRMIRMGRSLTPNGCRDMADYFKTLAVQQSRTRGH